MQQKHIGELHIKEIEYKKEISRLTRLVEKLCAWFSLAKEVLKIEKLCLAVGFSAEQTRNLVAGKEIQCSGTLYSEEHKRSFTAMDTTAQVKRNPTSKQLVLHIGGTSIGEWFREQLEKIKVTIRQPLQSHKKERRL